MKLMITSTILGVAGLAAFVAYAPMTAPPQVAAVEDNAVIEKVWTCPTCSDSEKYVLSQLQEHTRITDRNALATILGNIKQESLFTANICEGGDRVNYKDCTIGGYGLIQWTSVGRYNGLGSFCNKYECNPSTLEGQTRYMINENIFQKVLPQFEGGGQTVSYYMKPAYYWLGWGIKGNRELYAYTYVKKMALS